MLRLRFALGATRYSRPYSTHKKRIMTSVRPLEFADGPLVWIDCEMTGLNIKKDKIIEIAVLITNGNLDIVDDGLEFVIKADKAELDGMDEWCTKQHGNSGLTQACLQSPYTTSFVADRVLEYIKKWIPRQRVGMLAGNSIHADRTFLVEEMPQVVDWLHYRMVDVSSIKELSRRWYSNKYAMPKREAGHRALEDIRGSIEELKFYRENIFRAPTPPATE
ncbi:ribonuclease H-like protein [Mycena floridula]|nr:ribonuclease H-like protein [Mycena floridula]